MARVPFKQGCGGFGPINQGFFAVASHERHIRTPKTPAKTVASREHAGVGQKKAPANRGFRISHQAE
jgi:hypothetical protein